MKLNKKIAYVGCLGMIGIITTEFGIIGILPQIAVYYGITIDKAAYLLSAFALVIALTGPFMTLLFSGFDRKKIMLATIFVFLFSTIVSAFSPPFWLLMIVRMLPAFLQPVYIATAIAAAVSSGEKSQENQLMGIVLGGIALAMVTTVPVATYLASIFTWQISFFVQAIVSALALVTIFKIMPDGDIPEKKSYGSQVKILKDKSFVLSTAMNFFMIASWFSTYSYFADYLIKTRKVDMETISYLLLLFGVVGVFSNWLSGKMLTRSITKTVAFFLCGTVIIPVILIYSGDSLWITVIVVAIWGFFYAPCFLNASAYMISAAPNSLEFANSLATSFGNLGVFLGTAVGGWIISQSTISNVPWAGMGFGVLSLLMVACRSILEKKKNKILIPIMLSNK
ncbi:MFS transporter [Flavobacterium piscis]|uniref:Sugar transporter n=1 Tax=Flavobacterium piscis TaxID=1114874 RepID=A0ABX2XKW2_9FLAO|nr:MFS transporter [Flavobacterium piscis]OCB75852.1 sugar transporter [Flavobacterium piscis]OXG07571.1 MFS transporter [Flavobacterium piscis]